MFRSTYSRSNFLRSAFGAPAPIILAFWTRYRSQSLFALSMSSMSSNSSSLGANCCHLLAARGPR